MEHHSGQIVKAGMQIHSGDVPAHILSIDGDGVRMAVELQLEPVVCRHRRSLKAVDGVNASMGVGSKVISADKPS